jgi:hypothetical protein
MTSTLDRTTAALAPVAVAVSEEVLLPLLTEALDLAADRDDHELDATAPAGRVLVALSALARAAAADLGVEPGTTLTAGPGVVVVRDLASATRLLARTVAVGPAGADLTHLLAAACELRDRLLEVATGGR